MDTYRLVELLGLLTRRMYRYLHPIADAEGVSYTELVVLWKMNHRKRCRATDLAEDIGIPPSTLTGVLDRLVAKGLLFRVPDPEDRRAVVLEVGDNLSELLVRIKRDVKERLAGVLQSVPPDHVQQLITGLENILGQLDRDEGVSS